ncbi:MAG: GNAT family N-acetyltransferase [Candidatus Altiarchaeales archaeon]|nr:GNAT family N-acetyltransferase [Candidatus Altiarchaeales archaeon]MBD3417066.1 GNAT family N-acetyltransferase [Candidatus Altiarchaeales archaeon]
MVAREVVKEGEGIEDQRLKAIPNTGSGEFPKVFTLHGQLVGFKYHGDLGGGSFARLYLLPVSRREDDWRELRVEVTKDDREQQNVLFEDEIHGMGSDVHRPILGEATVMRRTRQSLRSEMVDIPAEGEVAEVNYRIAYPYSRQEGEVNLLRQGIGTALLEEAEEHARARGATVMIARAYEDNTPSTELLRKHGYIRVEKPVGCSYEEGKTRNMHLYYRRL